MRRLVTPFSLSNQPELIVRRHVMLLNFDPLRAIILRDRLLVLVPDGADSLLETLEKRVRAGAAGEENDIFGESPDKLPASSSVKPSEVEQLLPNKEPNPEGEVHLSAFHSGRNNSNNDVSRYDDDNEMDELKTRTWTNLPFELQCVDAVLHGVSELLSCQAYDIQKEALLSINWILKPGAGVGALARERLRTSKNNVRTIVSRINGFVRALTMLLNDDADMALMNLSRLISHPDRFIQPVSPQVLEEESDEPELILVSFTSVMRRFPFSFYLDLLIHVLPRRVNNRRRTCNKQLH
jgi:magnesium transporter